MRLGTLVLVVALLLGVFYAWHHHTVTASQVCLTAPQRVCVDRPTTTRRRG